jgi:hypothetical protein
MISMKVDDRKLVKDLNNVVQYSIGFLDGVNLGKNKMLNTLGAELRELVGEFIDANARVDPTSLHHVYEWYQTGSPAARLFDIDYNVSTGGLSLNGTLTQSKSIARNSKEPFYNKASIMEYGVPFTISPKSAQALRFEVDGEEVFTKKPVTITNPGGNVEGNFQETFRQFFATYASQSILEISGLAMQLKTSKEFDRQFAAGVRGGRSVGLSAGIKYISGGKN